jgi:polysaccharide export outer membrane protein
MKTKLLLVLLISLLGLTSGGAQSAIGRSDTVAIKVFRESDLDIMSEVSPSGSLTIPLIGPVKIAGLTTTQAEAAIEKKLRDGYLVRPQVSVSVIKRVVRTVTVLGQARQPGVFTLPSNRSLTLVEVIGMAGGMSEIANAKKVTLKNGKSGATRIVDVRAMMQGRSRDIPLSSGDVVHIPESWF